MVAQIDFTNFNAVVGEGQTITVKVWGSSPITSVGVVFGTDHGQSGPISLTNVSQSVVGGIYKDVWTIAYVVTDTHDCVYTFRFPLAQASGETNAPLLIVR